MQPTFISQKFAYVYKLMLACSLVFFNVPPAQMAHAGVVAQAVPDRVVYADQLANGWGDWSYGGVTRNFASTLVVHSGSTALATTFSGGWSGLQLGYLAGSLDISPYDTLRFWVHGGSAGGQKMSVQIGCFSQDIVAVANTWTKFELSFAALGMGTPRSLSSLVFFNNTPNAQPVFYVDDVMLVHTGATPATPAPAAGPALSIDANADRHPINPDIYGMNFAEETLAKDVRLPVRRWGGNSATRYNWQIDVHNTASDYYFENIPDDNTNLAALPAGSTTDRFVAQDRRTKTKTILTMPLIGWTPKRRVANHPYDCGFKVSVYGAQDSVDDPWDLDCGNGVKAGVNIVGNNPGDTSIAITTTFVVSWINHLKSQFGTAANGGVAYYNLDNEPMLWPSTHRDVHPQKTTYDEMRERTFAYAAAIKATDPTAQTLGPVVWGWCAYFYSAADGCAAGADAQQHGNVGFVEWYLQQMRAYEQANGKRILDYVDVHAYPQGNGLYATCPGDAATRALRLRSTRSLWDRAYVDESWIDQPIYLVPRMKEWVTKNYSGTKTSITEYNWGALGYLNGALAQADVLGILGREGLDLATLWDPPTATQPGAYAFRLYRNYDGAGSAFGETSIRAQSTNPDQLSVFAARRASDNALTVMVINKTETPLDTGLSIANFGTSAQQATQVFRYSNDNLAAIVRQPDALVKAGVLSYRFPPNSITLFVVAAATNSKPPVVFLPIIWR